VQYKQVEKVAQSQERLKNKMYINYPSSFQIVELGNWPKCCPCITTYIWDMEHSLEDNPLFEEEPEGYLGRAL